MTVLAVAPLLTWGYF